LAKVNRIQSFYYSLDTYRFSDGQFSSTVAEVDMAGVKKTRRRNNSTGSLPGHACLDAQKPDDGFWILARMIARHHSRKVSHNNGTTCPEFKDLNEDK
jgi:hypothetical protein